MYEGFHEEGDRCPEHKCTGELNYPPVENCSCHLHGPCSACVDNPLTCDQCGWEESAPDYKDIPAAPGLFVREMRPQKLDRTKIDYRRKMHSGSSMLIEGVYPEGTTRAEVAAVVKGTFGGRFEKFSKGDFSYVAYTD